jgi:hypothetical protein
VRGATTSFQPRDYFAQASADEPRWAELLQRLGQSVIATLVGQRLGQRASIIVGLALAAFLLTGGARAGWRQATSPGSEPMRPIVAALQARLDPGERVYVYWGAVPAFRYYWQHSAAPWITGTTHWSGLDRALAARQLPAVHAELAALARDPAPFWLVLSHLDEADGLTIVTELRRHAAVNVVKAQAGSAVLRVIPRRRPAPQDATRE